MNAKRIVLGGLVAGAVMIVLGSVTHGLILSRRVEAELAAAAPQLAGRAMSTAAFVSTLATQLIVGFVMVWMYAAMRPRFGPGVGTALKAGVVVWLLGVLFHQDWLHLRLMSGASYALLSAFILASMLVAAAIGCRVYTEDDGGHAGSSVRS